MADFNYSTVSTFECPCKECSAPKRHSECHAVCREYISWKEGYDKEKAKLDHEKWIKQIGLKSKF